MRDFAGPKGYIRDKYQMAKILEIVIPWTRFVGGLRLDFEGVVYVEKSLRGHFRWLRDNLPVILVNEPF